MECDKDACVYAHVYEGFQVFLDGEVEEVFYVWVDVYGSECFGSSSSFIVSFGNDE